MASIKFYLHKKKFHSEVVNKPLPIQISFSYDGKRVLTSTGELSRESKWDAKRQRVKGSVRDSFEINNYLDYLSENVLKYYRESRILGNDISRQHIIRLIRNQKDEEEITFIVDGINKFVEVNTTKYSKSTIQKFITLRNHLINYQKTARVRLTFEELSLNTFDKYRDYLLSLDLTNNTIAQSIKKFKWFLNWATERSYNKNLEYRKYKVRERPGAIVILEWDELQKLYYMEIENAHLAKVRDVFCFGCFTGLRYSDIFNLLKVQVHSDHIIVGIQKTKDTLIVPLNDYSKAILNRYKDYPGTKGLPVISNQKMNESLKVLGKLAGINTMVTKYYYKGAEKIEVTQPKFKFMTTHIARKTMISLAFERGVPVDIIMKLSNHKSHKVLERYLKVSEVQKQEAMLKAFSMNLKKV